MKRVLLVLPLLFVGIASWRLFGSYRGWVGPIHLVISAMLGSAALVAPFVATRPRAAIGVVGGLLAAQLAIVATTLAGIHWTTIQLFPDARLACAVAVTLVIALLGLARTGLWGRWLALALGAVGVVSSGLNTISWWHATAHAELLYPSWSVATFEQAWVLWVSVIGGTMIVALLVQPAVRQRFAARATGSTWTSNDRLVGLLRATLIAGFAAIPMLLVYAWLQPIVPATQTTALVLAGGLAIAGVLVVRGWVVGALLLVGCGMGLLAQTAVTVIETQQRGIAAYYAVFWVPAGLLAVACGARMVGPTLRLLRR
jgi:hypothetical protein